MAICIRVRSSNDPERIVFVAPTAFSAVQLAVAGVIFCKLAVNDAVAGVIVPFNALTNTSVDASNVNNAGATASVPAAPPVPPSS